MWCGILEVNPLKGSFQMVFTHHRYTTESLCCGEEFNRSSFDSSVEKPHGCWFETVCKPAGGISGVRQWGHPPPSLPGSMLEVIKI